MKPIKDVIEALRRELPQEVWAQASVTLQCVAIENGTDVTFGVVTSRDLSAVPTHAVTIQLAAAAAPSTTPISRADTAALAEPPQEPGHSLIGLLTRLFGPPGFDNAARASVFREIVEELSSEQLASLLEILRKDRTEIPLEKHPDSAIAKARTRLLRLIRLGPAGLNGGIDALLEVFDQQHASVVLETIRAQWKTQEAWIDTTPPGVRLE